MYNYQTSLMQLAEKYPQNFFQYNGKIYFCTITKIDEQGEYFISNDGKWIDHYHRDTDSFNQLSPWKDTKGYYTVRIHGENMRVHQIVAQHFVPNPLNLPEVHHIDGNKTNNCFCNLEWCTRAEHNAKHGKPVVALDVETNEVQFMFQTAAEAERRTGIPATGIRDCCRKRYPTYRGYIWMYLSEYEASENH